MNEGYKAWGALKSVLSNIGVGENVKGLYEGVIVQRRCTEQEYEKCVERRKVNVLETKCLRSLLGV